MSRSHTSKFTIILCLLAVIILASIVLVADPASAKNSLGIGGNEQAIKPTGQFAGLLLWISEQQKSYFKALTNALKSIRDGSAGLWVLVGMSFAYGVFHAAGPGHGKAVISSYMIANETAAKRGIFLSMVSAFLQAVVAIVIMTLIVFVIRGWGIKSSDISNGLASFSYLAIMLLGAWLLWTKLKPQQRHTHDHSHAHGHHAHDHEHGEDCGCGHSHMPDPAHLQGPLSLKGAWTAVVSVGIRPCTGAIIVLSFAFLNGLYIAGILSTFAMALGTGITVSTLAILAVKAKDLAIRFSNSQERSATILRAIEIAGAAFVFLLGLMMVLADLAG